MKQFSTGISKKFLILLVGLLCTSLGAWAQITVTGTVSDPDGEPLLGATVMAQGTSNGVATDLDGNFSITVSPNATLVFSYVGFDTQNVAVDGRTHIDVVLKENSVVLNEVVAIGYGTVKKSDATGSVAVIKPDEIEAGLATTAQDMLVGATPGVVVTTTGSPSDGGTIRIRGGSSLAASNDPLIVIDGVPMENGSVKGSSNALALVSPENIESMTVLKDASATAIFGSRASNGVILITTKKGQSGKPQVNFSANMYVATPRNYMDMMTADEYRAYVINQSGADSDLAKALGTANTDWQKEILRTSVSSDYNISVGGTAGWLPYRVAVGYTNNIGIIRTTKMDRLNASINLTPKFFDDLLSVNANLKGAYIFNQYEQGCLGGAIAMNPTLPVKNPDGNVFNNWTTYIAGGALAGPTTGGGQINTLAAINPVSRLLDYSSKGKVWQSVGNLQLDLKMPFLRELRANLNLGYEYNHGKVVSFNQPFSPEAWKSGHYVPGSTTSVSDGFASKNTEDQTRYNLLLDFYLNYNKNFDKIYSSLDVTAGYSWQKFVNQGHNWGEVYAPLSAAPQYAEVSGKSLADAQAYVNGINGYMRDPVYWWSSPYQLVSFFGRLQYGFKDRYLLTATVRRDGSSRFGEEHRWGTFPSVAFAWRAIDEKFLQGARGWLSDLKLRLTWGVTGQQDLGLSFPYLPVYNVSTNQNQSALNPVNPVNPDGSFNQVMLVTPSSYNADLKWEETTTYNIGLDFGFINNRIMASVDLYKRQTKDLLTYANYAAGSNLSNVGHMNLGDLENQGVEVNLITKPVVTRDFTWSSNVNVAYNQNKITRLAEGADGSTGGIGNGVNVMMHTEGQTAFSFYVYEQVYNADGTPAEGIFVDRNGDGEITDSDKYLFHSKDPKVTINWQNTFNWKNWDLGFSLRSNIGNWLYNKSQANNVFTDPTTTALPMSNLLNDTYIFQQARGTQQLTSDYFVQNATFVRCDNITLGYTWNNIMDKGLRIRLFGAVQNPFVITKYKGLDPEVFSGIDDNPYPKPITFTLGAVVSF